MKSLRWAKRRLDWLLNGLVGLTFFGMAVLVIALVILRYFFNSSIPGGNEALRFAFIFTTFIGAAVLVGQREHIAIHIVTRHFSSGFRRAADVLVQLVIAALSVYLLILSFRWIRVTGSNMAEELKFPLRYIQVFLPVGCGLATLYALINVIETLFDPAAKEEMFK